MISLEKAKALKEAGLRWEPKRFDWGFWVKAELPIPQLVIYDPDPKTVNTKDSIWLPRLDQLLAEIRKRGWVWILYCGNDGIEVEIETYNPETPLHLRYKCIKADTPEDAAAEALLWIMKEELHG